MAPPTQTDAHAVADAATTPDGLAVVGPDGRLSAASEAVLAALGWSADSAYEHPLIESVHPEDREEVSAALSRSQLLSGSEFLIAYRLRHRDGTWRQVIHRGLAAGGPGGVVGSLRVGLGPDAAPQRMVLASGAADRELGYARILQRMAETIASTDEPREMLDALVRTIGQGLALDRCLIFDINHRRAVASCVCEYLNPHNPSAFSILRDYPLSIFPQSDALLVAKRCMIVSHADEPGPTLAAEGSVALVHVELRVRSLIWLPFGYSANGYYLLVINQIDRRRDWTADEVSFIHSAATHASLAIQKRRILDERLVAEERLRQSQKMEAIGRLAGGIAHDFNNLLTAIIGYAELLRARITQDGVGTYVDGILQVADRASVITHKLLSFSRRQVVSAKVLDINALVSQLEELLRRLIGENIQLEVTLAEDAGCVRADPGQIELALVNLAVNGRDAMPEGGVLTIATARVRLEQPLCGEIGLQPGEYARITVKDGGVGMDRDTIKHLFEPFFTTKELGKGTGLGLSSVYGIVSTAHGGIHIDSAPGRGSDFSIYLPREAATERAHPSHGGAAEAAGGSEIVLLVEDDAILRELIGDALSGRGYRVLTASNGVEAMRIAGLETRIDLLLTDVVMPRMNGTVVARGLLRLHPGARLLFISGFPADAFRDAQDLARSPVLAKPFSLDQLLAHARLALDAPRPDAPEATARR